MTIHNNLSDIEVDTTNNRRDNPLATRSISRRGALLLLLIICIVGLLTALYIDVHAISWLMVYVFLGWLYSGRFALKNNGFFAVVILGICYGVMPWVLGYIGASLSINIAFTIIAVASFLYVVGVINLKDFKDVKGDATHNKKTILVRKGSSYTRMFILLFTSLGYLVIVVSTFVGDSRWLALVGLGSGAFNIAILSNKKVLTSASYRGRYGSLARVLFFMYAAIAWTALGS